MGRKELQHLKMDLVQKTLGPGPAAGGGQERGAGEGQGGRGTGEDTKKPPGLRLLKGLESSLAQTIPLKRYESFR